MLSSRKVSSGLISALISLGLLGYYHPLIDLNILDIFSFKKEDKKKHVNNDKKYIYVKDTDQVVGFSSSYKILLNKIIYAKSHQKHLLPKLIHNFSSTYSLTDADYIQIGQICDFKTLVKLARIEGINNAIFLPPPPIEFMRKRINCVDCGKNKSEHDLLEESRCFIASLPNVKQDDCINVFTARALKNFTDLETEEITWFDDYYHPIKKSLNNKDELYYTHILEALLRHVFHHCKEMIKNGLLSLLTRFHHAKENDEKLIFLLLRIIYIISNDENCHHALFQGGWIKILHKHMNSKNTKISSIAASILSNLESSGSSSDVKYEDGLFLLHPYYSEQENFKADVVFIHGLKGSAFRTWRQCDESYGKDSILNRTKCWPKDWLGEDISNIRILAIDYESELSDRSIQCHTDYERRSLRARSEAITKNLIKAGVGSRPIIWVSHSMGGIILKQILVDAFESPQHSAEHDVYKSTCGSIFYSVPHFGTRIVSKLTQQGHYLISLAPIVKELEQGSKTLNILHEKFKVLIKENNIPILSFGEGLKTSFGLNINSFIVSNESSNIDIGEFHTLPMNHLNTCKPEDKSSENYVKLIDFLLENFPQLQESNISIYHPNCKFEREYFLLAFG